jgi:hypothetical protein
VQEPDIAPLARRLAEENNVDWRHLTGSGDGGRVVERDVLGYLARVMAGEEDVDPTPEPVPDGMAAWPEDDVAAYRARGAEARASESPPTLDDELFLFDEPSADEGPAGPTVDAPDPEPAHGNRAFAADDDALLLVGDETDAGWAPPPAGGDAWPAEASRLDELPDLTDGGVSADERLSGDVHPPAGGTAYALPDLFANGDAISVATVTAEPDLFFDDLGGGDHDAAPPAAEGGGAWSADEGCDAWPSADDGGGVSASADDIGGVPASADDGGDAVGASGEDDRAWSADDGESWSADDDGHARARAVSDVPFVPFGDGAPAAEVGVTIGGVDERDQAARPGLAAADLPGVAFVRHGQVWRRRFDDRPLRKAVSEVAAELQALPSAVTAVLLARAAWRAGAVVGPIDVVRWHQGEAFRGTASGDLRTAVSGLETTPAPDDAAAVLVVADLSQLDLDEAVLHLDAPVLALGRSLGEGTWLCLSGDDVDPAIVASLGQIAELLTSPVRLLV